VGNTADDVEGCFAVGEARQADMVTKSTAAMQALLRIVKKDGTGKITVQVSGPSVPPTPPSLQQPARDPFQAPAVQ